MKKQQEHLSSSYPAGLFVAVLKDKQTNDQITQRPQEHLPSSFPAGLFVAVLKDKQTNEYGDAEPEAVGALPIIISSRLVCC